MEVEPLNLEERYQFFLQLGTLFGAGCPLLGSLESMSGSQASLGMAEVSGRLLEALERGCSLSEGMSLERGSFSSDEIAMVRLGETTGRLHHVLERVGKNLERRKANHRQLIQSTLYPILALCFAMGLVSTMAFVLLPRLVPIFTSFQSELPWPTRVVLSFSSAASWGAMASLLTVFLCVVWVRRRGAIALPLAKIPIVGHTLHIKALAEFASSLSTLIASGATLDSSLELLGRQSPEGTQKRALTGVRASLRNGHTLSESFRLESAYFPTLFRQLIASGEESGRLEFFSEQAAAIYLEEFQWRVQRMTQLAEPALLLVLGTVVGFFILACFLPFYDLLSVSL